MRHTVRGSGRVAAGVLLVAAVGLTGCSGDSRPPTAPPPGPGVDALDRAETAMTSLRSYAFRLNATMTQSGAAQQLGVTGRVQAPDRIQAEVSLAGRKQQVVGVPEGQFVFGPDRTWKRSRDTSLRPLPWPQLLGNLVEPTVAGGVAGSTVTGGVPAADAVAFGFPSGAALQSARAVVTLNAQHQVTKLDLTLGGVQGAAPVQLTEVVELDGFDQQAPVDVPGGVVA